MNDILSDLNKKELDEANKPAINKTDPATGFHEMDVVDGEEKPAVEPEVDPTKDPHLKKENKLPPANELEQEEEDPEQRKIAGEAPYVSAARPEAFTKEVKGGVVKEDDTKKEGVITGDRKSEEKKSSTTSTPVINP